MEHSGAQRHGDIRYMCEWYDIVVMQILLLYHHKKIIILCHICKLMLLFVKLKKYFTFYVFFVSSLIHCVTRLVRGKNVGKIMRAVEQKYSENQVNIF